MSVVAMEYASHPFSTFCFAELHTRDVEAATSFYGGLLGWEAAHVTGDFYVFRLRGRDVIAMRRADTPQRLIGFINVENADRTVAQVQALGGRTRVAPFETPGVARTAVIEDPEGAVFGVWEARGHNGAHVQDVPGTMWWAELKARDLAVARPFYTSLFGWSFFETQKYGIDLTVFRAGDVSACSALQIHPSWGMEPHWSVAFAVDDWDTAVERLKALGGSVRFWRDVPNAGRLGTVVDPSGADFYIMRRDVIAT